MYFQRLCASFIGLVALSSCGVSDPIPTIVGAVGTYNYQITPGQTETKVGTAITLQIRLNGQRVPADAEVSITGPNGWHPTPTRFVYPKNSDWVASPEVDIPPLVGDYTIIVKLPFDGRMVTTSVPLKLLDNQPLMPLTSIVLSDVTQTSVKGNWVTVTGANGYYARLLNGTDAIFISSAIYTNALDASFPINGSNLNLNPNKTNLFVVSAANFDTVSDNPTLPQQINFSDSAEFISLPNISPSRTHTPLSRSRATLMIKP
jgi:hypothetical protein